MFHRMSEIRGFGLLVNHGILQKTNFPTIRSFQRNVFKTTRTRNQEILDKLKKEIESQDISFTDNKTFQIHNDLALNKPKHYSRFDDSRNVELARIMYRSLQPITPNDAFISCTTIDDQGKVIAVSEKYPRMKFLKNNNLFPRDLRKIDTSNIDVAPSIVARSASSVLVNLLHIKALVKKDKVMIFDTSSPEVASKLGKLIYDLESKLKPSSVSTGMPYEFRALESILISVMSYLEGEIQQHIYLCGQILDELEDQIDRNKLRELLVNSKTLAQFSQKAKLIKDVLDEVLDSDETLASMYLSETKKFDPSVENPTDYADLEMLLEAYYNHCDEFVQKAESLLNDIRATEEIVNIILDANRNSLMLFELQVTVYTLGFTVATLVPAFYGMNLKNYIEDSSLGFGLVVLFSIIQGSLMTHYMFKKLRGVQKLTMMGSASMKPMKSNIYQHWEFFHLFPHGFSRWKRLKSYKTLQRLMWGKRNTSFDRPTRQEKDALWRMINNGKR